MGTEGDKYVSLFRNSSHFLFRLGDTQLATLFPNGTMLSWEGSDEDSWENALDSGVRLLADDALWPWAFDVDEITEDRDLTFWAEYSSSAIIGESRDWVPFDRVSSNRELVLEDIEDRPWVEDKDSVFLLCFRMEGLGLGGRGVEVVVETGEPDDDEDEDSDELEDPTMAGSRTASTFSNPFWTPSRMPPRTSLREGVVGVGSAGLARGKTGEPLLTIRSHFCFSTKSSASCCANWVRSSRHLDSFWAMNRSRSACLEREKSVQTLHGKSDRLQQQKRTFRQELPVLLH